MQVRVSFDDSQLQGEFRRQIAKIRNPLPFMKTWSNSVAKLARENARAKGGRRFWEEVAASCRVRKVTEFSAEVYTRKPGAALREFGGEIRPKRKKSLTIPISPEADGKSVGDFSGRDLFVIRSRSPETNGILGYDDADGFHALFVLRTRVRQEPDPWWPTEEDTTRLGIREAAFWMG